MSNAKIGNQSFSILYDRTIGSSATKMKPLSYKAISDSSDRHTETDTRTHAHTHTHRLRDRQTHIFLNVYDSVHIINT